jgi:hypothetical protein
MIYHQIKYESIITHPYMIFLQVLFVFIIIINIAIIIKK